jgi:hypothetical protein
MADGSIVETVHPKAFSRRREIQHAQFLAGCSREAYLAALLVAVLGVGRLSRLRPLRVTVACRPGHHGRLLEKATHAGPSTVDELMREETRAKAAAARLCRTDIDHTVLQPHTGLGLMQAAFNAPGDRSA